MKFLKRTLVFVFMALVAVLLVACGDKEKTFKLTLPESVKLVTEGVKANKVKDGTKVKVQVTVPEGQEVETFKVDGKVETLKDLTFEFTVTKSTEIEVTFKEKTTATGAQLKERITAAIKEYNMLNSGLQNERTYSKDNMNLGFFADKADNDDKKAYAAYDDQYAVVDIDAYKAAFPTFENNEFMPRYKYFNTDVNGSRLRDILTDAEKLAASTYTLADVEAKVVELENATEAFKTTHKAIKGVLNDSHQLTARQSDFLAIVTGIEKLVFHQAQKRVEDKNDEGVVIGYHYENDGEPVYNLTLALVKNQKGVDLTTRENYEQFAPEEKHTKIKKLYDDMKEFAKTPTWELEFKDGDTRDNCVYSRKMDELTAKDIYEDFKKSIVFGTKEVTLDPTHQFEEGAEVVMYSHSDEDCFYKTLEKAKKQEGENKDENWITLLKKVTERITELQTQHNFKLVTKGIGESDLLTKLTSDVAAAGQSAIVRIPQYNFWTTAVERGLLLDLTPLVSLSDTNELEGDYKDHVFNAWQVQRGQIKHGTYKKQFGIQRFDGKAHHDPFMYNETLLLAAGIELKNQPFALWKRGEWTIDKMHEMATAVKNTQTAADKEDVLKRPLAINPQSIAWDGLAANGIDISNEIFTNPTIQNQVVEILNKYKAMATADLIIPEKTGNYKDNAQYAKLGGMNMQDASRVFESTHNAFTASAGWQFGFIGNHFKNNNKKLRVVPWPQLEVGPQYYSAVYEGDMLAVSRGKNALEVAMILLEINKAHIDPELTRMRADAVAKYVDLKGADEETINAVSYNDLLANDWVYGGFKTLETDEEYRDAVKVLKYIRNESHIRALPLQVTRLNFALARAVQQYVFGGGTFKDILAAEKAKSTFDQDLLIALSK